MSQNNWHTYSICLNKNNGFFFDSIKSFLIYVKGQKLIDKYFIGIKNGNINFSIKGNLKRNANIISLFKKYIKANSLGFPVNTISSFKYNLTPSPLDENIVNLNDFFFSEELSILILDSLKKEELNDETLLTFSLFLQFGWIRIRHEICNEPVSDIILKGYFFTPTYTMNFNELTWYHEENKKDINDIYAAIVHKTTLNESNVPFWMEKWLQICKDKITDNQLLYVDHEYLNEITYYLIPDLINQQLGLSEDMKLLQSFFINRVTGILT